MKKALSVILITAGLGASAQEYNIGIHLNPVVNTVWKGNSVYDKQIRLVRFNLGYTAGADVNIRFEDFRVETGASVVVQYVSLVHHIESFTGGSYAKNKFSTTSIELPLLLGRRVSSVRGGDSDHDTYAVLGLAGGAIYNGSVAASAGSNGNGSGPVNIQQQVIAPLNTPTMYIAAIAGVHVNAILKNFGLVDYGISYHMPIQTPGPYNAESIVNSGGGSSKYTGSYYPRMAYVNFKMCYYFFSADRKNRIIKYKLM